MAITPALTVFSRKTLPSLSQKDSGGVSHLVGNTTTYIFTRKGRTLGSRRNLFLGTRLYPIFEVPIFTEKPTYESLFDRFF
jgi:hypothetical protein